MAELAGEGSGYSSGSDPAPGAERGLSLRVLGVPSAVSTA